MTEKNKKIHSKSVKKNPDKALWEEVMKDVTPLKNKNCCKTLKVPPKEQATPTAKKNEYISYYRLELSAHITETAKLKSKEVDERTYTKFKRGQMPIDGRLDLHGMTQHQAYDELLTFIPRMYVKGARCLLVITGKGNRQNNQSIGVLKKQTPIWLNDSPLEQYILKIHKACPNHGGDGALYVLLRRDRG